MTKYDTKLTKAQAERLALLAEEAAEVTQAVTKILRHGYDSTHPRKAAHHGGNRDDLMRELGDLLAVIAYMEITGDLVTDDEGDGASATLSVATYTRRKFETLVSRDYLHYQKDILDGPVPTEAHSG